MHSQLILPDDFARCKRQSLGGKAFHLIGMKKAALQVPDFFVIPTETIANLLQPFRAEIEAQLSTIKTVRDPQFHAVAKRIEDKILSMSFPSLLIKRIQEAVNQLFGAEGWLAVRSSATAEDGAKASFAGQHESHLFVSREDLIAKIKACITSAWSFGALSYRLAQGIPLQDIKYAVIIQQMVEAEKSGVSFSMNLNGNMADMIMVAGYGLGEGIVTDQVETDSYTIHRQQMTISKKCAAQYSQVSYSAGEGLIHSPLATQLADSVLDDEEIMKIFELTMATEQLLGKPADVEFSFDKKGQLFLLQMRPITTIDFDKIEILDNTNIVESYPGITLPLSFSFALEAYEKVFKGSSKAFWVADQVIEENALVFKNLLAHYGGRIYYRLDNWYKMMSLVYSSAKSMSAWEKAVGLTNSEKDKVKFTFQKRIKTIFSVLLLIFNYRSGNRRFFKQFDENYKFLQSYENHLDSPEQLWKHYESASSRLFKPWYLTLVNDFLAFKFFGWLQDFIAQLGLPQSESLANDLLCGIGGVESEEAILNVLKLKDEILADSQLLELFEQKETNILAALQAGRFPSFHQLIQHHLQQYGDRTLAELKLETPSLRKDPISFLQLLKNQLATSVATADFAKRQEAIRTTAEKSIATQLKWWNPKTYIFKYIRRMAAYGLKSRENMRFCRTRGYGAVKDIFLQVGQMMEYEGLLQTAKDVFYLSTAELRAFCIEGERKNKKNKIEDLKQQYADFASIQLPDRVIYMEDELPLIETNQQQPTKLSKTNQGIAVSKGIVTAEAAIVIRPEPHTRVHGKILVSKMTDPGWVFLMMQAVGLISEKGSLLSHTAIVGRELGIPVVVGLSGATMLFKDGDVLKLDGSSGIVEKI